MTTLGSFMAAIDSNIVVVALPSISRDFGSGLTVLGWVVASYVVTVAALLLQSGKMGDIYGRKKVYLAGFAIFGAASALCGLSANVYELIGLRVVQGVGAAFITVNAYPIIYSSFPANQRGAAIGVNSTAWAVGAVTGPVLGGFLTSIDWRLIFFVNVPVAVLAVAIGARRISESTSRNGSEKLNLGSSLLVGATIATVMLCLTFFEIVLVPIAVALLALSAVAEAKSRNPLIDRSLIHNRGFMYATLGLGFMDVTVFGVPFAMSFYYQSVLRFSPLMAGIWLSPVSLLLIISNPIAGRVYDRFRLPIITSVVGALAVVLVLLVLSSILRGSEATSLILVLLAVAGAAGGFTWVPAVSSALSFASEGQRALANGTIFTLVQTGYAASVAIVISLSVTSVPPSMSGQLFSGSLTGLSPAQASAFSVGLSEGVIGLAVAGAVGMLLLLLTLREQAKLSRARAKPNLSD